jgi:hypothetical protein
MTCCCFDKVLVLTSDSGDIWGSESGGYEVGGGDRQVPGDEGKVCASPLSQKLREWGLLTLRSQGQGLPVLEGAELTGGQLLDFQAEAMKQ